MVRAYEETGRTAAMLDRFFLFVDYWVARDYFYESNFSFGFGLLVEISFFPLTASAILGFDTENGDFLVDYLGNPLVQPIHLHSSVQATPS